MLGTLLVGVGLVVCCGFLVSNAFTALAWLITLPFNVAHTLISFCMWAPRFLLSLFPGVSGLVDFLFTTAVYSVFEIHAPFAWSNAFGLLVVGSVLVKFGSSRMKKLAVVAYLVIYCATFLYITLSTLLPMFLLAAALGLASKGIASFFPRARPKYTGPLLGFAVSLLLHFFFLESPQVISSCFSPCF